MEKAQILKTLNNAQQLLMEVKESLQEIVRTPVWSQIVHNELDDTILIKQSVDSLIDELIDIQSKILLKPIFKVNDKVQEFSGGPEMSIIRIIGDKNNNSKQDKIIDIGAHSSGYEDGDILCKWYISNTPKTGFFKSIHLKKIN